MSLEIHLRVSSIVEETCRDHWKRISDENTDREIAIEALLSVVYEKLGPVFQSDRFKLHPIDEPSREDLLSGEIIPPRYRVQARSEVSKMINLVWEREEKEKAEDKARAAEVKRRSYRDCSIQ